MGAREAWKEIMLYSKRNGALKPEFLTMTDEEILAYVDGKIDGAELRRSHNRKSSEPTNKSD